MTKMSKTQLERVLLVAVILLFILHLLSVPFWNVHLAGWTLDLEQEPNPVWVGGVVVIASVTAVLFALMTKKVLDAIRPAEIEVRRALQPAAWSTLSVTSFTACQALLALSILSTDAYEALRLPTLVALGLCLLSLAIFSTLFARCLQEEHLKKEWNRLLVQS